MLFSFQNGKYKEKDLELKYSSHAKEVDGLFVSLQEKIRKQKIAEEAERVRKIQEEMEMEKFKKEEEIRKKKEEEEIRKRFLFSF